MFFILLIAGLIGWFLIAWLCDVVYKNYSFMDSIITSLAIITLIIVIGFITSFAFRDFQFEDYESIAEKTQNVKLLEEKKDLLAAEFSIILAEYYPEHEREIFENFKPDDIKLYLVKYPEIRAVEGLKQLVSEIDRLNTDMYNEMMKRNSIAQRCRYRFNTVFTFKFIIPDPPEGYEKFVFQSIE